jgi:hypothetical protein
MYGFITLLLNLRVADATSFPAPTQACGIVKSIAVQPPATTPNLRSPPKRSTSGETCGYVNVLPGRSK